MPKIRAAVAASLTIRNSFGKYLSLPWGSIPPSYATHPGKGGWRGWVGEMGGGGEGVLGLMLLQIENIKTNFQFIHVCSNCFSFSLLREVKPEAWSVY